MHPTDPTTFEDRVPTGDREAKRANPDLASGTGDPGFEREVARSVAPGDRESGSTTIADRPRSGGLSSPTGDPREELHRIDALNEAIRDVVRALPEVTSSEGIADALQGFVTTDLYDGVTYLDGINLWESPGEGDEPDAGDLPAGADRTALAWRGRTGTPPPLERFTAVPTLDRGSWALIPVRHGETRYGHLVLTSTRPAAFGRRELGILEGFGETLGVTVDAVADRRLLRSDAATELTFASGECVLAAVAGDADCRLSLQGIVSGVDVLAFFRVGSGDPRRVVDAATSYDAVETARATGDGTVELALDDGTTLVPLARGGTTVRSVDVGPDAARLTVEVAPGTDVRALLERVREHVPDARLAAKRELDRPPATDGPEGDDLDEALADLTDRQLEVVEAAYRAGYFEWPRERTAEEVAESIGISSPTFHKHLRSVENVVLSALLDTEDRPR